MTAVVRLASASGDPNSCAGGRTFHSYVAPIDTTEVTLRFVPGRRSRTPASGRTENLKKVCNSATFKLNPLARKRPSWHYTPTAPLTLHAKRPAYVGFP